MNFFKPGKTDGITRVFLLALMALFVSACGSSNKDYYQYSGQYSNPGYIGHFLGSNYMSDGQIAVLDLTAQTTGALSGTLTVGEVPLPSQGITPAGVYSVSGSFDSQDGTFEVNGTLLGVGPFAIIGILPADGSQGSYTISLNGQQFSGIIQNSQLGTPTPPQPSPDPTPGGDLQAIVDGTLTNFVFNADGNYNGDNPPVSNDDIFSGAVGEGDDDITTATAAITRSILTGTTLELNLFVVSVNLPDGEDLVVGHTYSVPVGSSRGAIISLNQINDTGAIEKAWSMTPSTTGSFTITSLTDSEIEFDFSFSNVGPNSEVAGNAALGTFSTSGHIKGILSGI